MVQYLDEACYKITTLISLTILSKSYFILNKIHRFPIIIFIMLFATTWLVEVFLSDSISSWNL